MSEMIHPDFPTPNTRIISRKAARIIVVDENNLVPLIYSSTENIYKIPGGGIDEGESIETACLREAKEETGCEVQILGTIGKIINTMPATLSIKGDNFHQTSYCFYGNILSKGEISFTDDEKARGFELKWVAKEDVLMKMKNCKNQDIRNQLLQQREILIFQAYLDISQRV